MDVRVQAPVALAGLHAELIDRVTGGELPSVAVGVIRDGRILWEEAIGWADRDKEREASVDMPYGVASLGKSVTAMAVMVLAERGLIDLEAPATRYLGDGTLQVHEGDGNAVTVRRLLDMTAAIPHGNYVYASGAAAVDAAHLATQRGHVVFPAGETEVYSNFAYGVLERVIERVSGRSYPDFMVDEVFAPLGMGRSLVGASTAPAGAALKYQDGTPLEETFPRPQSSLAMHCSLDDLLRYAALHLGQPIPGADRLLGPATLARLHEERSSAPHALMALGWASLDLPDGTRWLLTNGRSGGTQATLTLLPAARLGVVVLSNVTGNATDELAFRIADALLPGFLEQARRLIEAHESWANRPYEPSPAWLGRWAGEVVTPTGALALALDFQADGDVHAELGEEYPTLLTGVTWDGPVLTGRFRGRLPLDEATDRLHRIDLGLRPSGRRLTGWAVAVFTNDRGRFELPTYVWLERAAVP
jgi:CubicO group peptidase (beta-lactamase class C family)